MYVCPLSLQIPNKKPKLFLRWPHLTNRKPLHPFRSRFCTKRLSHKRVTGYVCAFLGRYAGCSGDSLPTFRDNPSAQFSRVKNLKRAKSSLTVNSSKCRKCLR